MQHDAALRYDRSLDEHFRSLSAREIELVRHARAHAPAFLLHDDARRALTVTHLDRPGAFYIGRAQGNDIVLASVHSVSATHAKVEREASVWFLEDLNSKNGTFLGQERILDRRRLRDGDVFGLSPVENAPRFEFNCAELSERTVTRTQAGLVELSAAQRRLLAALCVHRLLARGEDPATDQEMARVLIMAPTSMRSGLTPIYRKCGLADLPQSVKRRRLADLAMERGLVRRDLLGADLQEIRRRLGGA